MRKIIALLTVFCATGIATAQTKGSIEAGFNIGLNISSMSSDDYYLNSDARNSFNAGASLDFYFNDRWSIKVKGIYDKKGFDNVIVSTEDGQGFLTNFDVAYITVPVMANWHFGRKRNWYLNFGPYVGFLASAKETRFDNNLKESFNTTDAGLAYGIGVKIPVSNLVRIYFEFEQQSGFSDIFKNNYSDNNYLERSAFNVGVNFLLK